MSSYEEIDVDVTPGAREEMRARSGRTHASRRFSSATSTSADADELAALEADGRLDPLLK